MQYKCIAKNALGNSDGAITLYRKTNTLEHLIIVHAISNCQIKMSHSIHMLSIDTKRQHQIVLLCKPYERSFPLYGY